MTRKLLLIKLLALLAIVIPAGGWQKQRPSLLMNELYKEQEKLRERFEQDLAARRAEVDDWEDRVKPLERAAVERAAAFRPADWNGEELRILGMIYLFGRDYARASEILSSFVARPGPPEGKVGAYLQLASCYIELDRIDEAEKVLGEIGDSRWERSGWKATMALAVRVEQISLHRQLAVIRRDRGEFEAAIKQALAGLSLASRFVSNANEELRVALQFEEARLTAIATVLLERAGRTDEARRLSEEWKMGTALRRPQVNTIYEQEMAHARAIGGKPQEIVAIRTLGVGGTDAAALGGNVVLIGFWALWNSTSVRELEKWRDWQSKFGERGLRVIGVTRLYGRTDREDGISSAKEWDRLSGFYAERRLNFPIAVARLDDISNEERYAVAAPPAVYLVDRAWRVRSIYLGRSGERDLERKIELLLGEG